MNNLLKFRPLEIDDIKQVLKIYNFHIVNGMANFEEKPFTYKDFSTLSQSIIGSKLPFIVCEEDSKIIGFSFLNHFRNKSGYRFTFENTIYIDNEYINKGIGNKILKEIIKISLKNNKIKTIIAVIGSFNAKASIKIHEKNGFNMVGTLKKVGYKKNQWMDSIYMQKLINE